MHLHVRIELFGGPEDGREITLPLGTEGAPMTLLPLPMPGNGADRGGPSGDDVAWYEKAHCRSNGVWIYRYKSPQSSRRSETL